MLEELVFEEEPSNRFTTISSLLLGLRFNETCCAPWLPTLREICSPPPAESPMLIVIWSGLALPLLLLRLRIISGPLLGAGADTSWAIVRHHPDCSCQCF